MTTLLACSQAAREAAAADASPTPPPPPTSSAVSFAISFDRSEGGTLYFKVPAGSKALASVKADLYETHFLGTLTPEDNGLPYFLFTARPCPECLQERNVYLVRPSGGEKPAIFVHPGRIVDARTGQLILESRAFFGRCLRGATGDQYVVFQKERIDRKRKLQNSIFLAEPRADHLSERLLERGLPSIESTLSLVRQKICHEIDGRYRMTAKKAFDLRSRAQRAADSLDDENDEDDAPTKDDQTDEELSADP